MSHHGDCKHCGEHLGYNWGYCPACTPHELIKLEDDLRAAVHAAEVEWDTSHFTEKKKFIYEKTLAIQTAYVELWNSQKPKDMPGIDNKVLPKVP